jgi:hypothetical protein
VTVALILPGAIGWYDCHVVAFPADRDADTYGKPI